MLQGCSTKAAYLLNQAKDLSDNTALAAQNLLFMTHILRLYSIEQQWPNCNELEKDVVSSLEKVRLSRIAPLGSIFY
jgi:hypothetical protein